MQKLVLISLRQDFIQQIINAHCCHWCNHYKFVFFFFFELLKLAGKFVFLLFWLMQWQHSEGEGVEGNSGWITRERVFKIISET